MGQEGCRDPLGHAVKVPFEIAPQNRRDVGVEIWVVELCFEIVLELLARNRMPTVIHIGAKSLDNVFWHRILVMQGDVEVEEVAPFFALIERTKLCPKELIQSIASVCQKTARPSPTSRRFLIL